MSKLYTLDEWSEECGDVMWWCLRDGEWLAESPYVGSPLDMGNTVELHTRDTEHKMLRMDVGGWPDYHTHWQYITVPEIPKG